MDTLSPQQRHKVMSAIHGKDTKPELTVRRYLWAHGFRYRLNSPRLPGHPDIVLRKYNACVFVNGCFWHGHEGCRFFRLPQTNAEYWRAKIEKNRARDKKVQARLAKMGWSSIVIWECQLRPAVRQQTLRSLVFTLNHLLLANYEAATPATASKPLPIAAEPEAEYGKKA